MTVRKITFPKRQNETGSLTFLEGTHDMPFEIRRVYYIYEVAAGARRGFHAHKKLQQVLICIHGSCKILLDDGQEKEIVTLSDPTEGLMVGHAVWREMFDFSPDAVLLVLASEFYDEGDYIRDYDQFLQYLKEEKHEGTICGLRTDA